MMFWGVGERLTSKPTFACQFRALRALVGSPKSKSTSVGRK